MARGWIAAGMLALGVLAAAAAEATVLVPLSLEEMVQQSAGVVRARVLSSGVQLQIRGNGVDPTTITRLVVDEWIVGSGGDEVLLREIGGEHSRGGMAIAGTPEYAPGEEVIVVLEADGDGLREYRRTFGMVMGKFAILRGAPGVPDHVVRDTRDVGFARWVLGEMVIESGERSRVRLDQFVARIRAAARIDEPNPSTETLP